MDSKGRSSWVGNIYQKFEKIVHDVDEFVTKDTAKFLEDQMQAVNEGVKKLYTNVQGDKVEKKAQEVERKKDDATGDSVKSLVKEDSPDFGDLQLSEPVVDDQKQLSLSLSTSSPEDIVDDSHPKESSDAAFSETATVSQKDVGVDNNGESSNLRDHGDHREQNRVTVDVESPEDIKSPLPSDVSCSEDPSRNVIEDTLSEEIECNTADSFEDLQTEYPSKQSDNSPTCRKAELVDEEDAVIVENPSCEDVGYSEEKSVCPVLCIKENILLTANDLCCPEDRVSDEDYELASFVKHSKETVVSEDRISCTLLINAIDDYADLTEKVKASHEQDSTVLEFSCTMEHPQVDSRSSSYSGSFSDLPFCLTEEHPTNENPSLMKAESLCEIKLISAIGESTSEDKFSSGTSFRGEYFRVMEEDEVLSVRRLSGVAGTDLCFDNYHSFMPPELGPEENNILQKQPQAPIVGIEGYSSPSNKNSSATSLISLPEPSAATNFPKLMSATEPLDDKAICSDVLSSCNVSSEHDKSSNISWLYHEVKPNASSSLPMELLNANSLEKTEEMCSDHAHPSYSTSDLPTAAFVSLSDLGTRDETGKPIASFSGTSSTASGHFQSFTWSEEHDLSVDTLNDDLLETINLSDEPKLEDIRSKVDDELLYTPSFRYRRFGSYKELIKDAFTKRKRLVKEYQQLPIWYGDFDSDLNHDKHLSPPTEFSEASNIKSLPPCDTSEPDWELL